MKKIYKHIAVLLVLSFVLACSKESLDLPNPNEPGDYVLNNTDGLKKISLGIYLPLMTEYWWWFAEGNNNWMGDVLTASVGNFGWRWGNQVSSIHLSNGIVLTPPDGGTQPEELRKRNERDFGDDNIFNHAWTPLYLVNGHANYILSMVDAANASDNVKNIVKAWAYFWKGWCYSRVGSLYTEGIINDELGTTNNNYVDYTAILEEATANFDQAITLLNTITGNAEYNEFMGYIIPQATQRGKGGVLTPQEWIRSINTHKARNILVNKYASELTPADLAAMKTLLDNGVGENDKIFTVRSGNIANYSMVWGNTTWSPLRAAGTNWERVSERLIQDFKTGDLRLDRNFTLRAPDSWDMGGNPRGVQYNSRWVAKEDAEYFSWVNGLIEVPLACSYDENALMLAEYYIRSGSIETGLGYIDAVRTYQNSGLAPVAGTGLNLAQALEELRSERRVGLFMKYVAFYDARRWGVLKPLSQGGGRTGVVVVLGENVHGFAVGYDTNATIEYNYLERFDVPAQETDFNPRASRISPSSISPL